MTENAQQDWQWLGRYIAVILTGAIMAAALGSMELFETSRIGAKLTAANLVKFLGYGAALAFFWLLGQRAAETFGRQGGRWKFLAQVLPPLVTLIVVSSAYKVLLLVLRGMMDGDLRNIYNWVFILGIIAAAGWLVAALFNQSASLAEAVAGARTADTVPPARACTQCGAPLDDKARFCGQCGASQGE